MLANPAIPGYNPAGTHEYGARPMTTQTNVGDDRQLSANTFTTIRRWFQAYSRLSRRLSTKSTGVAE